MQQTVESLAKDLRPDTPPREGGITNTVEQYTAKIPSMAWLWMAIGAGALSAGVATFGKRKGTANFLGLWVPSLLLMGVYNKLVKIEQSTLNKSELH